MKLLIGGPRFFIVIFFQGNNPLRAPFNTLRRTAATVAYDSLFISIEEDDLGRAYVRTAIAPGARFLVDYHPAPIVGDRSHRADVFALPAKDTVPGGNMDTGLEIFVYDFDASFFGIEGTFMYRRTRQLAQFAAGTIFKF
jgi:hypothetical protein